MPGWLDTNPQLTRRPDAARRRGARRHVRDPADLGRRPPHRLPHLQPAARPVPVRRVHPGPRRRPHATACRRSSMIIATAPFVAGYRVAETKGQVFGRRRPQPRPRRQPHGGPAVHRRRRDPRVHEPARGHPTPGDRPDGPERDADRRRTPSSRCASTAPSWPGRCPRSSPTGPRWCSSPTPARPRPRSRPMGVSIARGLIGGIGVVLLVGRAAWSSRPRDPAATCSRSCSCSSRAP